MKPSSPERADTAVAASHLPTVRTVSDRDKATEYRNAIEALEHEADDLKKEIRMRMPKSLFMPVPRQDLLELLLGGVGIVIGLATFGVHVIATVGRKITQLTPSRGFAAELAAASTIVIASGNRI